MQKKNLPDTSASSNWAENVKKQQRTQNSKKYIIWAGIIGVCILAFVGLIYFANKSSAGAPSAGTPVTNLPPVRSTDIIEGDPKSPVTITEYADLQCPACAEYNPLVNQVLSDYKGKVRVIFRFFPLQQHQHALIGAQAAYAGWKLGKFGQLKDAMFDKQSEWEGLSDAQAQDKFTAYAKSVGLNADKFKQIMDSAEAKNRVAASEKEALGMGLESTPTFFLGNTFITPQNYNDFKALIDQQLSKSK